MANCDVGFGTTVVFGTSAFAANIESVSWSGMERDDIECTHMGTTGNNKEFIPGDLYDPGEIELEVQHDPNIDPHTALTTRSETITVTWPQHPDNAASTVWACSGYMKSYEAEAPLDDKMTATVTVKCTGTITFTPSS